jgi:hypothetical protein
MQPIRGRGRGSPCHTKNLEVPEPILYLKRVSTGDFEEALAALLGKGARGVSGRVGPDLKVVCLQIASK